MAGGPTILVVDNYDSFVYNLVQYLGELGASVIVRRNDDIEASAIDGLDVAGVLISPRTRSSTRRGQRPRDHSYVCRDWRPAPRGVPRSPSARRSVRRPRHQRTGIVARARQRR